MKKFVGLMVAAGALMVAPSANAALVLYLDDGNDGVAEVTQNDNVAGDLNGTANAITFTGVAGGWSITVAAGISKDQCAGGCLMDLVSLTVHSAGPGTLNLGLSDSGFALGPTILDVGGTLTAPAGSSAAFHVDNVAGFGQFILGGGESADLVFGPGPYGGSTPSTVASTAWLIHALITCTGACTQSFDANLRPIPEPASVMLLGGAVLVTVTTLRKRMKKA